MAFDARLLAGISVLASVVETGSFTRAGEILGLSPSGVSRTVSRLEERIGVRLLDRSTRSLRLTSEGTRLYDAVAPHLAGIEEAADLASGAVRRPHGALRVSANGLVARHLLAPHLADFTARFPDLEVTLTPQMDVGDLARDGVDVALRFGPQPASGLSSRLLLETRVLTVAAPAYLAVHGRPATPAELERHECIQFLDPQRGRTFDWEFRRGPETVGVQTRGRLTFTDPDTMITTCRAGAGIAQVLALGVECLLADGSLVELFPDWPDEVFPLYAVRTSRRLAPAKVEVLLEFLDEIVARHGRTTAAQDRG